MDEIFNDGDRQSAVQGALIGANPEWQPVEPGSFVADERSGYSFTDGQTGAKIVGRSDSLQALRL